MNILIIGCQKEGSNLARSLDLAGHEVSVLAQTQDDLHTMDDFPDYSFSGLGFVGIPVDIENLRHAGIQNMDAIVCMTPDDNINLMVAQIAKEMFHVQKVLCRIADPVTKEIFSTEFGLQAICPTNIMVESAIDLLLDDVEPPAVSIGSHTMGFVYTAVPSQFLGKDITTIPPEKSRLLIGVLHENQHFQMINEEINVLQPEDKLVWTEFFD